MELSMPVECINPFVKLWGRIPSYNFHPPTTLKYCPMPSIKDSPCIQVDTLNPEGKDDEECIQLALQAVTRNGFKENGQLWLSLHKAAECFKVSKTKLVTQFNGRKTNWEAHIHESILSFGEEIILAKQIKEMGYRGIPLHTSAVALHASTISGMQVSEHWVARFCMWHPELKDKWTTGLEQCYAQSLNCAAVVDFYNHLQHLQEKYDILDENVYNMDEKGIQLRMGKRVHALVNCDQKTVHQVKDGNHELVTIIECVCADWTAICPSVVFKGTCWNL